MWLWQCSNGSFGRGNHHIQNWIWVLLCFPHNGCDIEWIYHFLQNVWTLLYETLGFSLIWRCKLQSDSLTTSFFLRFRPQGLGRWGFYAVSQPLLWMLSSGLRFLMLCLGSIGAILPVWHHWHHCCSCFPHLFSFLFQPLGFLKPSPSLSCFWCCC